MVDTAGAAATYMVSELCSGRLCSTAIHTFVTDTDL